MTQDWDGGYIAEIGYMHDYFHDMSPGHIRLAMLLNGDLAPDTDTPFTYCELGSGQGLTANILAAANPHGQFWATDFNPVHAHNAARLAAEGGAPNIRFLDHDFAAMSGLDLPQFDIIALHGIWSWVNGEVRKSILDFIARRLKVGGVVYVSYNTLPGWAAAAPLRELLTRYGHGQTITQRVTQGLAMARRVQALKPLGFTENPMMGSKLDSLADKPLPYLAHEYFNAVFEPNYFHEVATEMARAKLGYAAAAHIRDNIDTLNFNADALALLADIPEPGLREGMRDFLSNRQFRRDLYVRGPLRLPQVAQAEALLRQRLVLIETDPSKFPMKLRFPAGEVALRPEIYTPILARLAAGPASLGELLALPGLADLGLRVLQQAVGVLSARRAVMAAQPEQGQQARQASTRRFNAAVLARAQTADDLRYLASPLTGGGVNVNRLDQLFLLAGLRGRDPVDFAWEALRTQGQRVSRAGKSVEGDPENRIALGEILGEFTHQRLPLLRRLGVV